jgi:hypothetical protein
VTSDPDAPARDALVAELAVLRARLRGEDTEEADTAAAAAREQVTGRTGLDQVAEGFGLTPFERATLLLAAGPELVAAVADELVAAGSGPRLTFGAALACLPGAHWSALTPPGPLRRWDLVRLVDPSSPTRSPLVVDERVLHHLAGAGHLDPRLAAISRPLPPPGWLPESMARSAGEVVDAWQLGRTVLADGPQGANVRAVVAAAAGWVQLTALLVDVADLPPDPADRERLLRWMERETVLGGCAWVLDVGRSRPEEVRAAVRAVSGLDAPVAVVGSAPEGRVQDDATQVVVERLAVGERRVALGLALCRAGAEARESEIDAAAGVFDLALEDVEQAAREVAAGRDVWDACRTRNRVAVGSLATVRAPHAGWDDLVLPSAQLDQLRALVASVRHRALVLDDWGFGDRSARGVGSTALFAGPSGTGKTLAAEVIAGDLGLDLVQVDLSQIVSKWIGETEKHLARLFDAAEGGCVLLFDEADTIFGRRSEVRDSHDRYANLEVGYLLQRMEAFRGLAVLTTNARGSLDPAFTRRLRTVVTFPYPDAALRASLWEKAFPPRTPVDGLEPPRLARIDVPGGGIASIALTAAYLAAEGPDPGVTPDDVRVAARWELAKSGRTAPPSPGRDRAGRARG